MDKNSLAHTTWECKYYIVFAPKYRRKIIQGVIIDTLIKNVKRDLTRREQEIPHLYRWWDELRSWF